MLCDDDSTAIHTPVPDAMLSDDSSEDEIGTSSSDSDAEELHVDVPQVYMYILCTLTTYMYG